MKAAFSLFLSLLLAHSVLAQLEEIAFVDPPRTESIGLTITPIGSSLVAAVPVNPRFGIWYKHEFKPGWRFRVGINGQVFDPRNINDDDVSYDYYLNDSTLRFVSVYKDEWNADLRMGIEYFKAGKKNGWVVGADVIIGNAIEDSGEYYYDIIFSDSISYGPGNYYYPRINSDNPHYYRQVGYLYGGLQASAGYRAMLTRWLEFQVQFTPEIRVEVPVRDAIDSNMELTESMTRERTTRIRGGLQPIEGFLFVRF